MTGPDEQPSQTDDTEGHLYRLMGDEEASEGGDDTEGHRFLAMGAEEAAEGEDDVMGHVQPPPDWQHLDRR